MNVAVPGDMDILYVRIAGETSLTVKVGKGMIFGPVAAKGGFKKLAPQLQRSFPNLWPTEKEVETVLMILHLQFIDRGSNQHGIPYPFTGKL